MGALERHGRVDGVANCIGNVVARSTLATGLKELEEELRVNLYTSFNIVKSSVKAMVEQHGSGEQHRHGQDRGGSIVLVSAAVASHGLPNYEAMSAAKAGVEGLARSAAATYAAKGVRINCVAPGLTKTPQTTPITDNERVRDVSKQMHPLKSFAEPSDIASAIEFLLQPENSFITGQVLAVDGGLCTLHPHHAEDYGV